jgi:hypothetical protein
LWIESSTSLDFEGLQFHLGNRGPRCSCPQGCREAKFEVKSSLQEAIEGSRTSKHMPAQGVLICVSSGVLPAQPAASSSNGPKRPQEKPSCRVTISTHLAPSVCSSWLLSGSSRTSSASVQSPRGQSPVPRHHDHRRASAMGGRPSSSRQATKATKKKGPVGLLLFRGGQPMRDAQCPADVVAKCIA